MEFVCSIVCFLCTLFNIWLAYRFKSGCKPPKVTTYVPVDDENLWKGFTEQDKGSF